MADERRSTRRASVGSRRCRCWVFLTILLLLGAAAVGEPEPGRRRGRGRGGGRGGGLDNDSTSASRKGKTFSLFSIVQFNNGPCASTMGLIGSSNNRNGTCYTATECADKGGAASGNCAAGFGVCCVFVARGGVGATNVVERNCTYAQNPAFPSSETAAGRYDYVVRRCSDDVCFFRLDFETLSLPGTTLPGELGGGVCNVAGFQAAGTLNSPIICGTNTGEHMYLEFGRESGDQVGFVVELGDAPSGIRAQWDVKITQIECANPAAPPAGCLQYVTDLTGRFKTFGFLEAASTSHLRNQEYSYCIRPAAGFCCIQYQACPDVDNPFSISPAVALSSGAQDDACATADYIGIAGSSQTCNRLGGANLAVDSRYCGDRLNSLPLIDANSPVCDCTPPFAVDVFTDGLPDTGIATIQNTSPSRGACLDYTQVPC